ncbi:hypothetical protein EMCRGX_G017967 [Ephydatia muelleri]
MLLILEVNEFHFIQLERSLAEIYRRLKLTAHSKNMEMLGQPKSSPILRNGSCNLQRTFSRNAEALPQDVIELVSRWVTDSESG